MIESPSEASVNQPILVNDIILHEDDLTEQAKKQFEYHTKVLDMFEQNRRHIIENDQISSIGRHLLLFNLEKAHRVFKRVLNYTATHQDLLDDSLPDFGPLIICGLPRTGSTLLYNLLGCDPNCRAPFLTDMFLECVPPIPRSDIIGREQRTLVAKQYADMRAKLVGRSIKNTASHPSFPIEEDFLILEHAGLYHKVSATTPLDQSEPSRLFYEKTNKDYVYAYHKTFLRMLNTVDKPSSHWLLKSPFHNFSLDALLRQYSHAALIMTHRTLEEVIPSFCRMLCTFDYFFDETNLAAQKILKSRAIEYIDQSVESILEFYSDEDGRHDQVRNNTCHVFYEDLMKDPISTVRQIYEHFGLCWSDQFEMAMQTWLRENPQGKQGRNSYSLSDFDLTEEDIIKRYTTYIDLFLHSSQSPPTNAHS